MTINGLYQDAAYEGVRNGCEFVTTARVVTSAGAAVATLSVVDGTLTMDEEWSPYVQAQLVVLDPGVTIDPRLAYRLIIDAGYVYSGGVRDVVQLANLFITQATLDLRTFRLTITAASDEVMAQTTSHFSIADDVQNYTSYGAAIINFLQRAQTSLGTPTIVNSLGAATGTSMTGYTIRTGDIWWNHVQSVRDMAGAEVFCDETRTWQVRPYTVDVGGPSIFGYPCTGDMPPSWPGATDSQYALPIIGEASVDTTRDDWANAVVLNYSYPGSSGTTVRVAGIAELTTGPYRTALVGFKVLKQERTVPTTASELTAACNAILFRSQKRGERREFTARAMFWMRPRTMYLFGIHGANVYHRVTRVSWRLDGTGTMTINTRTPDQ